MKSILNKLGYVFIFLFIGGTLVTGYYLYTMPELLQAKSIDGTTIDMSVALSFLHTLNIIAISLIFIGLVAFTLLLTGKNGDTDNIVYVETYKEENTGNQNNDRDHLQSKYEGKIDEIKKLIDQGDHEQAILNRVLSKLCKDMNASQGAIFKSKYEEKIRHIELVATFAYSVPDSQTVKFEFGEGLAGQAAKSGKMLNLKNVPEGYIQVLSGLGAASPTNLLIIPLMDAENALGVIEIASFEEFSTDEEDFLKVVASLLVEKLSIKEHETTV